MCPNGPPGRLYLVFNQEQVGRSGLPVRLRAVDRRAADSSTSTTWLTYRASRHALSPVIALAKVVRAWDPKRPDLAALDPRSLSTIGTAMSKPWRALCTVSPAASRNSVEREQQFHPRCQS